MKKTYKLALTIASCVLIAIAVTTMGVSYAVWTSNDGAGTGGETTVSPSVTPYQNYVWAKYFGYEIIDESNHYVAVTEFYSDVFNGDAQDSSIGINLQDVYIPDVFWVRKSDGKRIYTLSEKNALAEDEVTTYYVTRITNRIFKDATLRELPVTIYIQGHVTSIATGAFTALPNLEKVVLHNDSVLSVEYGAFVNCPKLSVIQKSGTGGVTLTDGAILGCATDKLSS